MFSIWNLISILWYSNVMVHHPHCWSLSQTLSDFITTVLMPFHFITANPVLHFCLSLSLSSSILYFIFISHLHFFCQNLSLCLHLYQISRAHLPFSFFIWLQFHWFPQIASYVLCCLTIQVYLHIEFLIVWLVTCHLGTKVQWNINVKRKAMVCFCAF